MAGRPKKFKKPSSMTLKLEESRKKKLVKKYGSAQATLELALLALETVEDAEVKKWLKQKMESL